MPVPPTDETRAIDRDAARLRTGHHVTPRLLAACRDGSLTPFAEVLMSAHVASCRRCADLVLKQGARSDDEVN